MQEQVLLASGSLPGMSEVQSCSRQQRKVLKSDGTLKEKALSHVLMWARNNAQALL